jgi:hypothetical protein
MNQRRVRQSLNCGLAFCALLAASPVRAAITYITDGNGGQPNPPVYQATANPPSDPESVSLIPNPVTRINGASNTFQNLLNSFNNGFFSGTGANAGNGHNINYNPGALNGTLTLDEYQALSGGEDRGIGHLKAHYTPGAGDPALGDLRFVQLVTTNYPGGVTASTANGDGTFSRVDGAVNANKNTDPFYPFPNPRNDGTNLNFTDYPGRNCRAPHYPGADFIDWTGDLLLASYNGTTLNVYGGVQWGWDLFCPPQNRPASVIRSTVNLPTTGASYAVPTTVTPTYSTPTQGPTTQVRLSQLSLQNMNVTNFQQVGPNEIYTLSLQLNGQIAESHTSQTSAVSLAGVAQIEVMNRTGETEGDFTTQMLGLTVQGTTGPIPGLSGPNHFLQFMTDGSQSSTGSMEDYGTIMTDASDTIPQSASPFMISSFFDVFTELSLDNGPFTPNAAPNSMINQSVPFNLVPEPSSILLAAFGGSGVLLMIWRRRRVKQSR